MLTFAPPQVRINSEPFILIPLPIQICIPPLKSAIVPRKIAAAYFHLFEIQFRHVFKCIDRHQRRFTNAADSRVNG